MNDGYEGWRAEGCIAVNGDGTLYACMDSFGRSVVIKHATKLADVVVDFDFLLPRFACFARHGSVDTLLISDYRGIVEASVAGACLRTIALGRGFPYGIAYCAKSDVIAVSLSHVHAVSMLQYESTAEVARIGPRLVGPGSNDELHFPMGLRFTADGARIIVCDHFNNRVSMYSATTGVLDRHLLTLAGPTDVVLFEDGGVLVAESRGVTYLKANGCVEVTAISPANRSNDNFPRSLAYCSVLDGVFVKDFIPNGSVAFIKNSWGSSPRSSWVSACVCI